MNRRGRRVSVLLVIAFLVVPLAELYVLIQVGQAIGAWWTILLLLADSVLGAWLIKREGRRALQALQQRVDQGRLPAREVADGALVVLGGALLLSPGFVTDVLGVLLVLPLTRPLFRGLVVSYAARKGASLTGMPTSGFGHGRAGAGSTGPDATRPGATPTVVRGEVLEED